MEATGFGANAGSDCGCIYAVNEALAIFPEQLRCIWSMDFDLLVTAIRYDRFKPAEGRGLFTSCWLFVAGKRWWLLAGVGEQLRGAQLRAIDVELEDLLLFVLDQLLVEVEVSKGRFEGLVEPVNVWGRYAYKRIHLGHTG